MIWNRTTIIPSVIVFLCLGFFSRAATLEPSFAEKSQEQKIAWGKSVFILDCLGCHTVVQRNKFGPHLHKLIGRPVGGAAGFNYSPALRRLRNAHVTWTEQSLHDFLANPQIYAPGVQMWIHVPDEEVIQALIAYLKDETTTSK